MLTFFAADFKTLVSWLPVIDLRIGILDKQFKKIIKIDLFIFLVI